MPGKRSLREHRTAAKAWDATRAAGGDTSRRNDPQWAAFAKRAAKRSRRQLRAQQGKGKP
jgi:hypothetical protein